MKIKPSSYFLIFLLVFLAVVIVLASDFQYLESKIMPIAVAGVAIVLGLIQLGKEVSVKDKGQEDRDSDKQPETQATSTSRKYGALLAWVVGFVAAIYFLGCYITTPIFMLLYLKLNGSRWLAAIVTAALVTICLYILFEVFLEARLWRGLISFP